MVKRRFNLRHVFRPSFAKLPHSLYRRDGEIYKKYLNSGGQACAFHCLLKFSPGVCLPKRQWNVIAIAPLFLQEFLSA